MGYNVIISDAAQEDITQTMEYLIENWSIKELSNFQYILERLLVKLENNPETFSVYNNKKSIYKVPVTKHNLLFYKLNKKKYLIEILRVFNVFQNPHKLGL